MALDKAVDSSVLDAGLKSIADAIREKSGTSDTLAFPDAMAAAIAAIEAGTSTPDSFKEIACGSYTPTSDKTSATTIAHGMSTTPDGCFYVVKGNVATAGTNGSALGQFYVKKTAGSQSAIGTYYYLDKSDGTNHAASIYNVSIVTSTTIKLYCASWGALEKGKTYYWFAFKLK